MAQMLVIYSEPADPAVFEEHYFRVHVPLAKRLPGLRRYEVSQRPVASLGGDPAPYLVATLTFDSLAAVRQAFATPEGKACAADRRILAPNDADVQMYLFESTEA